MEELYVDPLIESYVSNMIEDMGGNAFWQILGSTFAESFRETFFSMVTGVYKANILKTQTQNQFTNTLQSIDQEGLMATQEAISQWEAEQQKRQLRTEAIELGLSSLLMFAGVLSGMMALGFFGPTIAASLITLGTIDIPLKEILDKITTIDAGYLPFEFVSDIERHVMHEELSPILQEEVSSLAHRPVASLELWERIAKMLYCQGLTEGMDPMLVAMNYLAAQGYDVTLLPFWGGRSPGHKKCGQGEVHRVAWEVVEHYYQRIKECRRSRKDPTQRHNYEKVGVRTIKCKDCGKTVELTEEEYHQWQLRMNQRWQLDFGKRLGDITIYRIYLHRDYQKIYIPFPGKSNIGQTIF